ncbi:HAD-IA family hydrolase [Cytobacillus oceanisediminis]|uniref:HAD family hydrolase n=1 Tax=Cytobacillus oceanisediminis TaxID=665099 RepID=UPI001CCC6DF1|nr:HAD-IA family hydrolase [Cytobacillus oceanisediminis]MBZ9536722.1 HAD-IA family hydrolase [Cytobacillus oceanisediminis]
MSSYKAVLFDLDDTLLDRDNAVDKLFFILLEKCYEGISDSLKREMLQEFKEQDKRCYGQKDKTKVFESFFDSFPPKHRIPHNDILTFWNQHFPYCFSVNQDRLNILNRLKSQVKVAIITNGTVHRQKAKIRSTNLHHYFDTIIISDEVGISKPDKRIFVLALNKLNVQPEDTLFVGDDLEIDIGGCQNTNIKGVWFNPLRIKNDTEIKPFAEIDSFDRLLSYFT